MADRIDALQDLAKGLTEIPANEQSLGHFQMAMREALLTIVDELRFLRNQVEPLK